MTLSPHRSPQRHLHDERDQTPSLWRTRRGGLLVLAAVLVVLVLVSAVLLGSGPRRGAGSTPTDVATAPSPASSVAAPAGATSTPGTTSSQADVTGQGLIAPPSGITWTLYRTEGLPTSPTAGPTRIDGPVYAGYAHTPLGALIAAEQITARALITPNNGWRTVVKAQVLPGPGRDQYGNLRGQVGDAIPAAGFTQIAGFRFITCTPTLTVISLASRSSTGTLQVTATTMHWVDGDWKLEIPASGLANPQVVSNIVGYVPWSGVS